jgi:ribosomal protein L7/L12
MADENEAFDWQPIDDEIYAGKKIQAIKLYREASGVGLKEAKDAVEERQRELEKESPGRFAQKSGCMSILLLAGGAGVLLAKMLN